MIEIAGQKIYPVDCLEAFKSIDDGSIDHISTSPPYNLGGFHADRKKRAYAGYSDDLPEKDYRRFIHSVINECYRVLKPAGSFFLVIKDRIEGGITMPPHWILDCDPYFGIDDYEPYFDKNPFYLKQEIIWHYPSTANVDKIRFYPLFERVFWFVKNVSNFKWNPEWAIIGNVWEISHITDRDETAGHPAPFPTQLSQTMILSTTDEGDTVLDPFLGSGTSLKVCRLYRRNGIGFERYYDAYKEIIEKRVMSDEFPETLLEAKKKELKGYEKPRKGKAW